MARRPALIKTKKKITRASPTITRRKKMLGPDFTGWEKMTGQAFNKFKNDAKNFYYENFQEADLLPEVWKWMKDNKYTSQDIKNAKAAKGLYALGVWPAIMCKMLYSGCPDYNKAEAEYWEALPGTGPVLNPLTTFIKNKVDAAIEAGKNELVLETNDNEDTVKTPTRQNIQEVMKERAADAIGEIESIADQFIDEKCPKEFATREKIHAILNEQKVLPYHINRYVKYWEDAKHEYEAAKLGKDSELKEGYSKYTKTQLNNMIRFSGQVIEDLNAYIAIKQATRAVRPKKAVPVEKIVSKLKYLRSFKDEILKIDITSVSPVKLHQATEAWV